MSRSKYRTIKLMFLSSIGTAKYGLVLFGACMIGVVSADNTITPDAKQGLGKRLFLDPNLSLNRTQSCATCHVPAAGFVDSRDNGVDRAVSLGDDGHSLGDRHAPTISYAMFSPPFHQMADGNYRGGQFYDGRATDLATQAGQPPIHAGEMGMSSKAAVVTRIQENDAYVAAFKQLYGNDIFADPESAYAAMANSIAAFERTEALASFDSRYDRFLRGEYQLTAQEELGRTLFFSQQFTNCNLCHQLHSSARAARETFSSYEYHNIGVPMNQKVRAVNGMATDYIDIGLLSNPQVADPKQAGKFKVSTLRNVAVTAPYMHNGIFRDLRTVVLFYNKYNSRSQARHINPETGQLWQIPEVVDNLSLEELETGPALDDRRIDALVAFMQALTDQRYEHLLTN